ncbi:MAG TPA: ArsB/NhaD family transporter [Anaerolineales bacterium]|nr:ArsB/NhaD family transporter [Anaerolineales bacterium]
MGLVICIFALLSDLIIRPGYALQENNFIITGQLNDSLGQPVKGAIVSGTTVNGQDILAETESRQDGTWSLAFDSIPDQGLEILVERSHFYLKSTSINQAVLADQNSAGVYRVDAMQLERKVDISFWIATLIFMAVLLLIAFEFLHSATAALAGISLIFLVSYIGGFYSPNLTILTFEQAIEYIDWEVVFLLIAMMIIIAIIEETGIFQWMAFQAYRLSRGRSWLLVVILMTITAIASALLDNFTTMLLMVPISLQIGMALGINPLALIIPEVLSSNVGGITTLVGTPTNILIGAYAGIGFNDFLVNQTVGVVIALLVMGGYVLYHYRKELKKDVEGISPHLYEKLQKNAQIEDKNALWKSMVVFILVFIGFILGERVHLVPAVSALAGATILLIWLNPNIHQMIKAVDWTTLVFFMALFMIVGAIQEVGLISSIAVWMTGIVGDNLVLGIFLIIFGVGTLSTLVANIPLTASMLPIVRILTNSVPGAQSLVLYYALSMGAAMGGNGFLIGGEANLVTAGITDQTNYPISFKEFLKVGLPVTYLTLAVGFIWLLIRF